MPNQETPEQKDKDKAANPQETPKEASLAEEQATDNEPVKTGKALPPVASGDDKIAIQKHDFYFKNGESGTKIVEGVEIQVINATDTPIGSALFEAVFYDEEGNTLATVEHKVLELVPNISRTFRIISSIPEEDNIKSYQVRIIKTIMTPTPTATGNEKLAIIKHTVFEASNGARLQESVGVELAVRNISELTIATAVFEATFLDIEGNVIDTIKHKEIELKPGFSRAVLVKSSITEKHKVKSYDVKITRVTTADVEKFQFRRQEMGITKTGDDEVTGTIKNISEDSADTAVVATFYNYNNESIGTKVVILKDIEPNTIRQFHFFFKPQEGDKVRNCTLYIGDIVE